MSAHDFEQKAQALLTQAQELVRKPDVTAEDVVTARKLADDAQELKNRAQALTKLEADIAAQATPQAAIPRISDTKRQLGEFLKKIYLQQTKGIPQKGLDWYDFKDGESPMTRAFINPDGGIERKDLVENVGASGGFLVPPVYDPTLQYMSDFMRVVRERATVMPMTRRQMYMPVLDQTGTSSSHNNFYAGVYPTWTEENTTKTEVQPAFRQLDLICHKLALYTQSSDELLDDSAIPLAALLSQLFSQTMQDELEWTFINGTGAGQPLGIANVGCGATIAVARQVANQIGIVDIFNMLSQFMGRNPIWLVHQAAMPQILQLNGPAGNPAYVWIGNGRDSMPTTLMGYPIYFIQNCPTLGQRGDIILADWSKYIIGERQGTTIEISREYAFIYDRTTWRAVCRYAGRPWLSAPLRLRDGVTNVSPFVVLDSAVASS